MIGNHAANQAPIRRARVGAAYAVSTYVTASGLFVLPKVQRLLFCVTRCNLTHPGRYVMHIVHSTVQQRYPWRHAETARDQSITSAYRLRHRFWSNFIYERKSQS